MQDTPSGVPQPSSSAHQSSTRRSAPRRAAQALRCGGRTRCGHTGTQAGSQALPLLWVGLGQTVPFVGNFEGIKRWYLLGDRHLCLTINGKG